MEQVPFTEWQQGKIDKAYQCPYQALDALKDLEENARIIEASINEAKKNGTNFSQLSKEKEIADLAKLEVLRIFRIVNYIKQLVGFASFSPWEAMDTYHILVDLNARAPRADQIIIQNAISEVREQLKQYSESIPTIGARLIDYCDHSLSLIEEGEQHLLQAIHAIKAFIREATENAGLLTEEALA